MLMESYVADLEFRLTAPDADSPEHITDDLVFAEGRLLHR